jgi:hypothetical protein
MLKLIKWQLAILKLIILRLGCAVICDPRLEMIVENPFVFVGKKKLITEFYSLKTE